MESGLQQKSLGHLEWETKWRLKIIYTVQLGKGSENSDAIDILVKLKIFNYVGFSSIIYLSVYETLHKEAAQQTHGMVHRS